MTTLENSYCRPTTDEEWDKLAARTVIGYRDCHQKDAIAFFVHNSAGFSYISNFIPEDRFEIPVSHLLDLLHDRITPWRLEEVGFMSNEVWYNTFELDVEGQSIAVSFRNGKIQVEAITGEDSPLCMYLTTFSDLLTLIRFLTPPTK